MKQAIIITAVLLAFTGCRDTNDHADAWGNFETRETIISAQSTGQLLFIKAERGDFFNEGTKVGLVDTTQYALNHQLLLDRQRSIAVKIDEVDARLAVLEVRKRNLEREAERIRRLLRDQAATQQQLDEIEGNILVITKEIEAAMQSKRSIRTEMAGMDAQIALALEQLNNCHIVNPVTGTILERYAEQHELVTVGKPLYKIADLSVMDLKVYVSGSQLPHIHLGQKVTVFIDKDERSRREMEGRVSWISSRAEFTPGTIQTREERVSQVYAVKISVVNDGSIKIGMPGEVKFRL